MISLVIAAETNPNICIDDMVGAIPFRQAICVGSVRLAGLLLGARVALESKDDRGRIALHVASGKSRDLYIARLLSKNGHDELDLEALKRKIKRKVF